MLGSKERPIIFSGDMVRAILDAHKSVTRRVMVPQPIRLGADGRRVYANADFKKSWRDGMDDDRPYAPGDRLWVRETWATDDPLDPQDACTVFFKATDHESCGQPWRPSIHMPRWASRITLEVTGVRVERVQEITEEGALAEGAPEVSCDTYSAITEHHRDDFRVLWDSLNAKRGFGWDKNPWVWVVEFRRLP